MKTLERIGLICALNAELVHIFDSIPNFPSGAMMLVIGCGFL